METQTQKIHSLLAKFHTAMLVTHGHDMIQYACPIGMAKIETNCDVWFFAARSAEKNREIKIDQKVTLLFQNDHNRYISLTGHTDLISDHVQIAALWKESSTIWFPDGSQDPNPILVRATSKEAEYWDAFEAKWMKHFFAIAKARVTGKLPQFEDSGQHEHVMLKMASFPLPDQIRNGSLAAPVFSNQA
jgi:general stress protein 26